MSGERFKSSNWCLYQNKLYILSPTNEIAKGEAELPVRVVKLFHNKFTQHLLD